MATQPQRGRTVPPDDPEAVRLRGLLKDLISKHDLSFRDVGKGSGADDWTVSRFVNGRSVSTRTLRQLQAYVDSRTLGTAYHKPKPMPVGYPTETPKLEVRAKYWRRTRDRLKLMKTIYGSGAKVGVRLGITNGAITRILAGEGSNWSTLRTVMEALDAHDSQNAVKSTDAGSVPVVDVVGDVSLGEDPHPAPAPVEQKAPDFDVDTFDQPPAADLDDEEASDPEVGALEAINLELTLLVAMRGKEAAYRVLNYAAQRHLGGSVVRPQTLADLIARTFLDNRLTFSAPPG